MKDRFIVMEAGDASGKATQTERFAQRLQKSGVDVLRLSFPDYQDPSSTLARMYLAGDFGESVDAVNAYAASSFFAVDRYASFQRKWKHDYEQGRMILADRYVASNLVHQGVKIKDPVAREEFFRWALDYEHEKLGLPRPNLTIFLDMEMEASLALLAQRSQREGRAADVHERDSQYLTACHALYQELASRLGWARIAASAQGKPLAVDTVAEKVWQAYTAWEKGEDICSKKF